MRKERIKVSPEMLSFVGEGRIDATWPESWTVLAFDVEDGSVDVDGDADPAGSPLVFLVDRAASSRLFDQVPEPGVWHLPSDLRSLAAALLRCPEPEPVRAALRVARSIELFCGIMARMASNTLVSARGGAELSEGDAVRILAARRLVDERWREKLTLDAIARACGLNRAKLTRGFRLLFDCSVADALAENRLGGAHRLLRETDLPVSAIGYACGYDNNASFTRAFGRRYGIAPTRLRQVGLAA